MTAIRREDYELYYEYLAALQAEGRNDLGADGVNEDPEEMDLVPDTIYCIFCDAEAISYYRRPGKKEPVPLCSTCFQAFEVGLSLDYDDVETGKIENMDDEPDDGDDETEYRSINGVSSHN